MPVRNANLLKSISEKIIRLYCMTFITVMLSSSFAESGKVTANGSEVPIKKTIPLVKAGRAEPADTITSYLQKKYSNELQVPAEKITNIKLYSLIEKWWRAPFKDNPGQTPTPEGGIDGSGLAAVLINPVYGKPINGSAENIFRQYCSEIPKENLAEGDLVFFCCTTGNPDRTKISQVGVFLQNNRFVHASSSKGVIISSLDDPYYWKDKFVYAGRVK